jgi:carboxyl-terminal processing protease
MRRSWRIAAVSVFVLTFATGALLGERVLALSDTARQSLRQYTELVQAAHQGYGTEVTYRDVVFASIQGMLRTLDPHTSFLAPQDYQRMRDRQQESFYGLGILVGMRNGQLTVIAPLEGTPASRMGIRAGDIIDTIEGEPTDSMDLDDAVQRLKGPKDTQVTITIAREGVSAPLEMTVTRAEIPLHTVRYVHMIEPGTGYMRITEFSRSTGREVSEALAELRSQGMERLLLDLRNNGGGLLDQAIAVADQFVPEGTLIVETRGRVKDSFHEYFADGRHEPLDLPLVVLVNGGSASAAEILAGAVQDHDVGLVVGTPTWGKGLVQTVYGLPYGSAMALTTAKYYTPSGRLIQRDYSSFHDYYARADAFGDDLESPGRDGEPELPRDEEEGDEPVFYTDLGRKVYGGGGITPDLRVPPEELHELIQFLVARSAFFEFGVHYAAGNEVGSTDWAPAPDLLDDFQAWLESRGLGTDAELREAFTDEETRQDALNRLRAEIFNSLFGNDAWYSVLTERDRQIRTALDQFEEAGQLLARRQQQDKDPQVAERERQRERAASQQ